MNFGWFRSLTLLMAFYLAVPACATQMTVQQANALFSQANAAYRAQKYEEAEQAYRQLLDAGFDSSKVLYNIGTTAARLDKTGAALAYLTRARQADPRNENIYANLYRVRLDAAKEGGLDDQAAAAASRESIWSRIISYFTAEEWLLLIWAIVTIASIGAVILLTARTSRLKSAGKVLLASAVPLLLLVALPGLTQLYRTYLVPKAIALRSGEVLSGPADRFTRVAQLREGEQVRSLGRHEDGYHRVRLNNGVQGYVESSVLMEL